MTPIVRRPRSMYLLHFEPPYKRCRHYIGTAYTDRLWQRWHQHATANGSRLTRAAVLSGCSLIVAAVWHRVPPDAEHRAKVAGHYSARCPVCAGRPLHPDLRAVPALAYSAGDSPSWGPTDWSP